MNDKGRPKEFVKALNVIARNADEDSELREKAVELVQKSEAGGDISTDMRGIKFQCLKCKETFDTEKQYRVHTGMNTHCGGVSPEDSDYNDFTEQMNVIDLR